MADLREGNFTAHGDSGTLVGGNSTTVTLVRNCLACRKELPPTSIYGLTAHDACLACPECRSDFVVWQHANRDGAAVLRCLDCLHRWEGKP